MKKKTIIFGNTNFSEIIYYCICMENAMDVVSFTVNEKYIDNDEFCGLPLTAFEKINEQFPPEDYNILVTVGYSNMNKDRANIIGQVEAMGYELASYISKHATTLKIKYGVNTIVMPNAYVGYNVVLGKGNIIYSNSLLTHHITVGDCCFFAGGSTFGGEIEIENYCFFGLNCTVKNGIIIRDFTLIGAGTYLGKNTEKLEAFTTPYAVKLNKKSTELKI